MEQVMSMISGFALIGVLCTLYMLPAFTAKARNNRNLGAIIVLNLLLGWTILGWVGALIWALCKDKGE